MAGTSNQVVVYDGGVGVEFPLALGGAFGFGIGPKIALDYARIICEGQYREGDKVYLLGFSRGAYTARALAGMLSVIGLPTVSRQLDRTEALKVAHGAFGAYSSPLNREDFLAPLASYQLKPPTIAMQ